MLTKEKGASPFREFAPVVSNRRWFAVGYFCFRCGELLALRLPPGNTDDKRPVPELVKGLFGKLFGDKGYVSQPLFEALYDEGVQLVTRLKLGMKNRLLPLLDKIMLRKRAIIESVNDQLKIQRLMGHADIKMTLRYVHPDEESLRAAVELAAGKSPRIVSGEAATGRRGQPKRLKAVG